MKNFVIISLLLLILQGCTAPLHNINSAAIPEARSGVLALSEVGAAIIKAGKEVGWEMQPQEAGHIVATHNFRTHQAVVDVTYSRRQYSITYHSSINLRYDGTEIHKTYNAWVAELSEAIDAAIASAQYK